MTPTDDNASFNIHRTLHYLLCPISPTDNNASFNMHRTLHLSDAPY